MQDIVSEEGQEDGAKGGGGGLSPLLINMDGVIAVGGDGLISELVKGLFLASTYDNQFDANNPYSNLPLSPLRLGIIPGEYILTD